ncbi:MAG: cell division protein FtsQ/DivIB [Pseudomonadota bacterium]
MTAALRDNLVREGTARRRRAMQFARRVLAPATVVVAVTAVVLLAMMVVSWAEDATRIERVRVEGSFGANTQGEIERSLATLVDGHSLLDVPMAEIARELGNLSWVSAVDVYRVWPHGLIVRVTEKVPVAHWNGDGYISHVGEVFQPENAGAAGHLPSLYGPQDKSVQVMEFYSAVNAMLMPLGLSVRELTLNNQLSWEIVTDTGMKLRVDQDEALSRIRRFLRVYESRLAEIADRIDSVDLRYIGGFAVHWAPPVAAATASTGAPAPEGNHGTYTR